MNITSLCSKDMNITSSYSKDMNKNYSKTHCKTHQSGKVKLPFYLYGKVVHGFNRGSTQLGFPTANIDPQAFKKKFTIDDSGVYYGFSKLENEPVEFMVMSIGTNPHFKNTETTVEVHVLKDYQGRLFYDQDFEIYHKEK